MKKFKYILNACNNPRHSDEVEITLFTYNESDAKKEAKMLVEREYYSVIKIEGTEF